MTQPTKLTRRALVVTLNEIADKLPTNTGDWFTDDGAHVSAEELDKARTLLALWMKLLRKEAKA